MLERNYTFPAFKFCKPTHKHKPKLIAFNLSIHSIYDLLTLVRHKKIDELYIIFDKAFIRFCTVYAINV